MRSWRLEETLPDGRTLITLRDPREHKDELLWPERFPEEEVTKLENALLQYAAAQLEQNATAKEGGVIKRSWIKFWSPGGKIPNTVALPVLGSNLHSWDCSFKGKDSSDPSCGGVWRRAGANFYLMDCEWGRWDMPGLCEHVKILIDRWPRIIHKVVEDKANGPAVIAMLQNSYPGFEAVDPQGGKEARMNAVAPLFKLGLVFLPHPSLFPPTPELPMFPKGWVYHLIDELTRFPRGATDDGCDMTSQALLKLHIDGSKLPEVQAALLNDPTLRALLMGLGR